MHCSFVLTAEVAAHALLTGVAVYSKWLWRLLVDTDSLSSSWGDLCSRWLVGVGVAVL